MIIFFLTPGPYPARKQGCDLYASFDLMAKGRYDPGLLDSAEIFIRKNIDRDEFEKITNIYTSFAKRSSQTARIFQKGYSPRSGVIRTGLLNEIPFTMAELMRKKDFEKLGVDCARQRFFKNFVKGKLNETPGSIFGRIDRIASLFSKEKGSAVCFSHSFLMKVLECVAKDRRILERPELLLELYDGKTRAYRQCGGFAVKIRDRKFIFLRKI